MTVNAKNNWGDVKYAEGERVCGCVGGCVCVGVGGGGEAHERSLPENKTKKINLDKQKNLRDYNSKTPNRRNISKGRDFFISASPINT